MWTKLQCKTFFAEPSNENQSYPCDEALGGCSRYCWKWDGKKNLVLGYHQI